MSRSALTAPSKSVPVLLSCSNMSRVASPIQSRNSDRCLCLVRNVVCFQVVILEPLGIFNEASVDGFWVPAKVAFYILFIADVDHHVFLGVMSARADIALMYRAA